MAEAARTLAGGGIAIDTGYHLVDLARFLVGEIDTVQALSETFIPERPLPGAGAVGNRGDGAAGATGREMGKVDVEDAAAALVAAMRALFLEQVMDPDVREHLPVDTPVVTPAQRQEQLRARREGAARSRDPLVHLAGTLTGIFGAAPVGQKARLPGAPDTAPGMNEARHGAARLTPSGRAGVGVPRQSGALTRSRRGTRWSTTAPER